MPKAKGYAGEYRLYLDEFESISYMTHNNPISKPQPGILPSVMKAAKAGKSNCRVTLQDPAIPGEPKTKKPKKVIK